jgi:hypothetical protein
MITAARADLLEPAPAPDLARVVDVDIDGRLQLRRLQALARNSISQPVELGEDNTVLRVLVGITQLQFLLATVTHLAA